jgi:hypothetical protein
MSWKTGVYSIAISLCATAPVYAQDSASAQDTTIVHGCNYGEVIDSSTPDQARFKMEAAGYSGVTILSKGCDNVWHARGLYAGQVTNINLAPDGLVKPEGN